MKLPFTFEQFISVFTDYNLSVFPMQVVLNVLAVAAVVVALAGKRSYGKAIALFLGLLWIWTGLVYHILFFSAINKAAYGFGGLYIIQGLMFLLFGTLKGNLQFSFRKDVFGFTGLLFLTYALVIYPVLGYFAGHIYPGAPTFGAPCPVTIFTFGILLLTITKVPWYLLVIPALWSLLGMSAAINLHITEDFGLVVSGVTGTVLLLVKNRKMVKEMKKGDVYEVVTSNKDII